MVERDVLRQMAGTLVEMARQPVHDCSDESCALIREIKKKPE
jgi:hypothetical protein